MVLNKIKKRSIKIMTHLGSILRFRISWTINPIYFCLALLINFLIPNNAPADKRSSMPVIGTSGSPAGLLGG